MQELQLDRFHHPYGFELREGAALHVIWPGGGGAYCTEMLVEEVAADALRPAEEGYGGRAYVVYAVDEYDSMQLLLVRDFARPQALMFDTHHDLGEYLWAAAPGDPTALNLLFQMDQLRYVSDPDGGPPEPSDN